MSVHDGHEFPKDEDDDENVIERYGPGPGDIVVWDTTSNYARVRELRLQGKTVPQIAAALDMKPSNVKQALTNHLKSESVKLDDVEVASILQIEMDRLDHLLQAHWFAAMAGDIESGKMVLNVSKWRREWLKWVQPRDVVNPEVSMNNNILVVSGTEEEFLTALQRADAQVQAQRTLNLEALEVEAEDVTEDDE